MRRSSVSAPIRALWAVLAVAMVAAFIVWGMRIGVSLGVDQNAPPPPVAVVTSAPQIVTVYTNIGPPDSSSLCAELSPEPREVTVESTSGVVIAKVRCTG